MSDGTPTPAGSARSPMAPASPQPSESPSPGAVVDGPNRPDPGTAAPIAMPAPRAPGNELPPPPAPARVRSRLVRFGARPSSGSPVLEPLMVAVRANHPKADLSLLERAYAGAGP